MWTSQAQTHQIFSCKHLRKGQDIQSLVLLVTCNVLSSPKLHCFLFLHLHSECRSCNLVGIWTMPPWFQLWSPSRLCSWTPPEIWPELQRACLQKKICEINFLWNTKTIVHVFALRIHFLRWVRFNHPLTANTLQWTQSAQVAKKNSWRKALRNSQMRCAVNGQSKCLQ